MNPTVSILIDNYNYGRFLRPAIDSCLAQTYPHLEIVVVDDGSTDDSPEIIRSYGDRIRAVLKANGGQASAFNAGFAASTGSIIMFLDADDYYGSTAVERIISIWDEETHIVHHRLQVVDANGDKIGYNPLLQKPLDAGDVVPVLIRQGYYNFPPTSGLAYSRKMLEKIMPIPEEDFRICADLYPIILSAFYGRITTLDETLAYYRVHGANAYIKPRRRFWNRRMLNQAVYYTAARFALVIKMAQARALPVPDSLAWFDLETLFEKLLLCRTDPSRDDLGKAFAVISQIVRKACTSSSKSWHYRLHLALLSLTVWLAPRFLLALRYPLLFKPAA